MKHKAAVIAAGMAAFVLVSCGDAAKLPERASIGPHPALPAPVQSTIPTVNVPPAKGWPAGAKPMPASGLSVTAFASGLHHPRWLYVLPNGDVLVAETGAPVHPDDSKGLRGWVADIIQKRAGAGVASADRIILLRDRNGDGIAETRTEFLSGLNAPFGMALIGHDFYVANTDSVVRYTYSDGDTHIAGPGTKITDLPAGRINHHYTKNILASPDGAAIYASVGSNSNAGENGLVVEKDRAAIFKINLPDGHWRIFASGLRNPVGLARNPQSGALWTVVNERDELGSDLVPDYLTSVKDGAFYGFPFSYYGQHVDKRVSPQRPDLVAKAIAPDYALGNHVASLGLAFSSGTLLPPQYRNGAFIGEHGSWNRRPLSGYKVVFVPFANGQPAGEPRDVLSGFVSADGNALGRPVGVVIDKQGALLVADDVGNTIWRVAPAARTTAAKQ
jgi:glucose/arabinose dehydrogenase